MVLFLCQTPFVFFTLQFSYKKVIRKYLLYGYASQWRDKTYMNGGIRMASALTLKNPQKILKTLASKPMTKWELKKEAKMEYSRVHEAIAILENEGRVKAFDSIISQRGRDMKIYGLTFKGTIAHLASLQLEPPTRIGNPGESVEDFKQRCMHEEEAYQKALEKLIHFLESQGRLLDYALFKEARWLLSRYGDHVFPEILEIARLIEDLQPFPSGAMQLLKHSRKELSELKQRKWGLLRDVDLREKRDILIMEDHGEGKTEEKESFDPFVEVNNQIAVVEQRLDILLQKENEWWQRGFAARFAERFSHYPVTGDMRNEALHKLFKKVADDIRRLEVESLESMADGFKST